MVGQRAAGVVEWGSDFHGEVEVAETDVAVGRGGKQRCTVGCLVGDLDPARV